MSAVYLNFDNVAMATSATPKAWFTTSVIGQILTAPATGPVQLSDQLGGGTLVGGAGDTSFYIMDSNEQISVAPGGGVDTIYSWVSYTAPTNVNTLYLEKAGLSATANGAGDLLIALSKSDTLISGAGEDVMVDSGAGGDFFSFGASSGHDVIYGFQASGSTHDFIQLTNTNFTTFADVQSHLTQVGADTLLTLSATDAVLLRNTQVSSLTASDFALNINLNHATPTFDDEFNSLSLYNASTGTGVWKTNFMSGNQSGANDYTSRNLPTGGEQEIYVDANYAGTGTTPLGLNPFSISNGVLTITATNTPTADLSALSGFKYTSGLLTTEKSFSQLYGYFEIKAELPSGKGMWPDFWLLPTDGSWPPELDVVEQTGGSTVYQTAHTVDSTGTATQTAFTSYVPTATTGFHTYGVLWTPTTLSWYIDGVEVSSTATPADMNKPMYMLVDLAVGGNFPGSPASNFTSAQLQVDYIRAYSLDSLGLGSTSTPPVTPPVTTNVVAPTSIAEAYTAKAGGVLNVNAANGVLANDVDHNGLTLTAALAANGGTSHGSLVLNADGSFVYTPTTGYVGTDSFTYVASDSASSGTPTTVTLNVGATPPTMGANSYAAQAGAALVEAAAQGVLANDVDNNGLTLTATLTANGAPAHGSLVLNADGSFTYTPSAGYAGTDIFTYVASDSLSAGAPTTVNLTVGAAAPTTALQAYGVKTGVAITETAAQGVLAKDVDNNGLTLTSALATNGGPAHGTLVLNADGSFTYTPTIGFAGTDSFTYIASDGLSSSAPTTVTLNVGAAPIVAHSAAYSLRENAPLVIGAANGVLSFDSDNNGLTLTASLAANGGPAHGTLVLNTDGSYTYTATAGYYGADSFTYVASDGAITSAPVTVGLKVVALTPAAHTDYYMVKAGNLAAVSAATGVFANDVDPNGLALTATLAANGGPSHGTLTLNADGSFNYTPIAGYVGADSFKYVASDSLGSSSVTTVNLNVAAGAPAGQADVYAVTAGAALTVASAQGVLANDIDNNGLALKAVVSTAPTHGTVILNADGSFTYTPNAGFTGTDSFKYIPNDTLSTGYGTLVTLNVGAVAAAVAPTAKADAYAANAGRAVTIDAAHGVLVNDVDGNGLTLTAALASNGGPTHGTLALNADGSFTYTPTLGFVGTDSFTYVASDSRSTGTPTTVTVNVAAQGIVTQAASYDAHSGATLTQDAAHGVLVGDTDPNGLTLTAILAANGGPSNGTVTLIADGSFVYTPVLGFAGTDSFTYIASDGLSAGTPTTVTLNVIDPPPTAKADAYAAIDSAVLSVNAVHGVLANDIDNNGLPLTASLTTNGGPQHGTLVLNADGSFVYTPTLGFVGTDSFTYFALDSLSPSTPTTVSITVGAQNITGGTGNDTYHVYNSADQITVAAGTPNETVIASASYALPANIQNLVLQGSGLTGTANALADTLTSLGGPNTLVGGSGNDTFYVNNTGDHVVVGAVHGNDLIVSSVSYALPDNVRSIQLTGSGLTVTANASGGDYLSSVGGGNTLVGSAKGNDTFTVAHSNDVVVVAAGAVNDTVNAYASFALPANVQNLIGKGTAAIALTGDAMANVIIANSGADTLTGGGGADTFVMTPGQKVETITDFSASGGDRIDITAYLAKGLNPTFHDFATYSTVSFSTGETIKLLGVHASDLAVSGHYVV